MKTVWLTMVMVHIKKPKKNTTSLTKKEECIPLLRLVHIVFKGKCYFNITYMTHYCLPDSYMDSYIKLFYNTKAKNAYSMFFQ